LVNTALWLAASDVSDILASGHLHRIPDRRHAPVPTVNCFRTADARWLWLQLMIPELGWQKLLAALDAAWLDDDPRFRGGGAQKLRANSGPFTELLDEIFRSRTLAEWARRLREQDIPWAPVRTLEETVNDDDVRSTGAFVDVEDRNGTKHLNVNTPCAFDGFMRQPTQAPEAGEDTDEVLASFGFSSDEISELRRTGALGDLAGPLTAHGPAMTN
jgi:crotonobetainyl-CoA:carnitine CoA-transferase CaiB-like acyl-CoA transferase